MELRNVDFGIGSLTRLFFMEHTTIIQDYITFITHFNDIVLELKKWVRETLKWKKNENLSDKLIKLMQSDDFFDRIDECKKLLNDKENSYEDKISKVVILANFYLKKVIVQFLWNQAFVWWHELCWKELIESTQKEIEKEYPELNTNILVWFLWRKYDRWIRNKLEHSDQNKKFRIIDHFNKKKRQIENIDGWNLHAVIVRHFSLGSLLFMIMATKEWQKTYEVIKSLYFYNLLNNKKSWNFFWESWRRHLPFFYYNTWNKHINKSLKESLRMCSCAPDEDIGIEVFN